MKIGVFGGTFDPVHIGHLILAAEALDQLGLDMVLWVLTPNPPHKKTSYISPWQHRLRMLELAVEDNQKFNISRVDIDRKPPHYASDTIRIFKELEPNNSFYYLMGLDSLNDIGEWHKPEELIQYCDGIGVMIRRDEDISAKQVVIQYPQILKKLHILTTPVIEISATDIRLRVANSKPYRYYLAEKVYRFILEHELYKDYVKEDRKSSTA